MTTAPEPARRPTPVQGGRVGELATLPVFLKLAGKRALVAGGSDGAAWKAELLAAAGAAVDVFAQDPSGGLEALAAEGRVALHRRSWSAADLKGAAVAIGDCADEAEAEAFVRAAREAGVPVNVVDRPAFCDFQFGSIVNRSPLVIGISTDGAAPVFGQAIRAKIETVLPGGFQNWARAAKDWRPALQARRLGFRARRTFWERFAALALLMPDRVPTEGDRAEWLAGSVDASGEAGVGSVALVGAGPGDPELLTLKAVRILQSADVVLYDDLVSPGIVEMARREAERITVGKRGHKPSCTQEEISGLLIALARDGKRVVRLKGGDPMIFGRAGEEISALAAAGIPFEVVPGVTAAAGAAARLGVSLDPPRPRPPAAVHHRARPRRPPADRSRLAGAGRPGRHDGRLHGGEDPADPDRAPAGRRPRARYAGPAGRTRHPAGRADHCRHGRGSRHAGGAGPPDRPLPGADRRGAAGTARGGSAPAPARARAAE